MDCKVCGSPIPSGGSRCSTCGRWHVRPAANTNRIRLCDVTAPNDVERIGKDAVGHVALSGGYPVGCVTLLGGEPGTGKSTLALQLASKVKSCLYIATEEDPPAIKSRAHRLGLTDLLNTDKWGKEEVCALYVVKSIGGDVWIDEALKGDPCELVILDSLSKLVGISNEIGAMSALGALKKYATENKAHVLVITHATKEDWFSGRLAQQHDVDATVVIAAESAEDRFLVSVKNRHGASGVKEHLTMTEKGLIAKVMEEAKKKRSRK